MKLISIILISITALATPNKKIEALKKKYLNKGDELSFYIKDGTGKVKSLNSNQAFIPASVFKIFSAYYILKKLGIDYKFKTEIAYTGRIINGVLKGDIIIDTSGDPYLLTASTFDLVESIRQKGITKVDGNLTIVNNFVNLDRIGNVGLEDQPYNQSISGLNLNFNRFKSIGTKEREVFPIHEGFKNYQSETPLGPGLIFKNIENSNLEEWSYAKKSKDYYLEVPLRNSLLFNAHYIKKFITDIGISIGEIKFVTKASKTKTLNKIYSQSSLELVKLALEYSNNLFIETLVLKATKKDSLKEAAQQMAKELKIKFEGEVENSSGLSVNLKLKASDIVDFIQKNAYKKFGNNYFINLLSITGHSGSLYKKYLTKDGFEKFRYKTGSLDYVYNICGQSFEANEKTFCIMINNPKKRASLMETNSARNERLREEAKSWRREKEYFGEMLLYQLN